jgi:DNA polymerase III alpha subunit (gram-positive type)
VTISKSWSSGRSANSSCRALRRSCRKATPAGLIDTLRLARHLDTATRNGLAQLTTAHDLTTKIDTLAAGSQPHRALWDTIAAAVLLLTPHPPAVVNPAHPRRPE